MKIEDLSFNDFLKSFEVKDARVESEQGKAGDADEPITPEANAQLEESPAHGSNEPGAGRIVDEPQPASVKKKKEFIPPTLEDVRAFFKEKGYKDSEALRMWNGYDVADWHDSQGKQIKNWKQKAYQVWFKDENKISASAQFVPSRQDQALERPAPPPWKSYDQQRREADEEAHKLEQQARQNRKEAPVIIPGFKMPELKGMP